MPTPERQSVAQLARIVSLTVYPPGEPPIQYLEGQILACGIHQGVAIAQAVDDDGRQVDYFGVPFKAVKAVSAGLVAPSGPLVFPSTS